MGLEVVKEEILNSAKAQASSLIAEAKKEADRAMKEAENKCKEINEKSESEIKNIIDRLKRQEMASAELEKKKIILESKKQILESVFAEAKKRLEGLSDKEREHYIKKLLERIKDDIEPFYFYCSRRDVNFLKGIEGIDVKPMDIIGGLIGENKDKTVIVDYSFEELLESVKGSQLQEVSKLLFG